jgi:uncharacterized protein (DUF1778 family)
LDRPLLVGQAAEASQRTPTDFVVDAAVLEPERLLADRIPRTNSIDCSCGEPALE